MDAARVDVVDMLRKYPAYAKDVDLLVRTRHTPRLSGQFTKLLYLYGSTGVGKTFNTKRAIGDLDLTYYIKPSGDQWWPDYDQEDVVILEEFSSCFTCTKFNQLCDDGRFKVQVKFGHIDFNSKFIICISNRWPEDQYPNVKEHSRSVWEAFQSRVNVNSVCASELSRDDIHHYVTLFLTTPYVPRA